MSNRITYPIIQPILRVDQSEWLFEQMHELGYPWGGGGSGGPTWRDGYASYQIHPAHQVWLYVNSDGFTGSYGRPNNDQRYLTLVNSPRHFVDLVRRINGMPAARATVVVT